MTSGSQTARQQARRQVGQIQTALLKEIEEREKKLAAAAVEVVAALLAQTRAEQRAGDAVRSMAALGLSGVEIAKRCGITRQQAAKLKNAQRAPAEVDSEVTS